MQGRTSIKYIPGKSGDYGIGLEWDGTDYCFFTSPEIITFFVTDVEMHEMQTLPLLIFWFFGEVFEFWYNTGVHEVN